MSDAAVLFSKPGAVSNADKKALSAAGIIVVEVPDLNDVKFVRAATELPMGDLMAAAGKAINTSGHAEAAFGKTVADLMSRRKSSPT